MKRYAAENKSNAGDVIDPEEEQQKTREQEILDQMTTEKHYYKLADYFVTIGLDNYAQPEEVYKTDEAIKRESMPTSEAPSTLTRDESV